MPAATGRISIDPPFFLFFLLVLLLFFLSLSSSSLPSSCPAGDEYRFETQMDACWCLCPWMMHEYLSSVAHLFSFRRCCSSSTAPLSSLKAFVLSTMFLSATLLMFESGSWSVATHYDEEQESLWLQGCSKSQARVQRASYTCSHCP